MDTLKPATRVFLICSGLGRINRGYESFTQECFEALSNDPALDMTLFKGAGKADRKQVVVWNLPRQNNFTNWLGKIIGKSGYWVEQVTFALSLLPRIARHKPDVIYLSDTNIGNLLWHWRRITRQKFKILFSNGGPMKPPYPRWDFVQQLAPVHLEAALAAGHPAEKQSLLPYGIRMEECPVVLSPSEQNALRKHLALPVDRPIVLSVGALNESHKRMLYVIQEMAAISTVRPYLVLLGQQDEETPQVRALAEKLLGSENYLIRTVAYQEIADYYRSANIFVLASLAEGFGRVFLEAMSHGLPCLTHDYALTRYVLGKTGLFADFEQPGNLSQLICKTLEPNNGLLSAEQRHAMAFERFSWQQLRSAYVDMLEKCAEA